MTGTALITLASLILIACLATLLASLGVLAINIKIYTEYLKDKQFESRAQRLGGPKV